MRTERGAFSFRTVHEQLCKSYSLPLRVLHPPLLGFIILTELNTHEQRTGGVWVSAPHLSRELRPGNEENLLQPNYCGLQSEYVARERNAPRDEKLTLLFSAFHGMLRLKRPKIPAFTAIGRSRSSSTSWEEIKKLNPKMSGK